MILSQLVRGAAEVLGADDAPVDGPTVARALRGASEAADAAVRRPVEGTMLTAARRAAEAAEQSGAADPETVLAAALAGGRRAVEETPELLEVLRQAGVVDSGALGAVILLEGLAAGLAGHEVAPAIRVSAPRMEALDHPPSRYRYCTSFLVEGGDIDGEALETALRTLGDSVLVMGDRRQVKVHVHTDAPERAAGIAREWGAVDAMSIDDMRRQEAERAARLRRAAATRARCRALLLADGAGVRELAEGLGAAVLPADATAARIDAALAGLDAEEAVIVAVGRVAGAVVVEAGSLPAALACLVVLDPGLGATANAAEMTAAAAAVTSVEIEGSAGELRAGVERGLAGLLGAGPALVTALIGAGADVRPVRGRGVGAGRGRAGRRRGGGAPRRPGAAGARHRGGVNGPGATARRRTHRPRHRLLGRRAARAPSGQLAGGPDPGDLRRPSRSSTASTSTRPASTSACRAPTASPPPPSRRWRRSPPCCAMRWRSTRPRSCFRSRGTCPARWRPPAPPRARWARRRVLVVESGSVCVALGLLALRLQDRLERGCTAGEVVAAMESLRAEHRCVFSLATLEYLQRGGRIGRAQAVVGSLLHVRPILQIEGGEVAPAMRVRGAHRVLPAIEEFLERHSDPRRPAARGLRPRRPAGGDPAPRGDGRAPPPPRDQRDGRLGRADAWAPTPGRGRSSSPSSTTRWTAMAAERPATVAPRCS